MPDVLIPWRRLVVSLLWDILKFEDNIIEVISLTHEIISGFARTAAMNITSILVKVALLRLVSKAVLDEADFRTVLCEIEARNPRDWNRIITSSLGGETLIRTCVGVVVTSRNSWKDADRLQVGDLILIAEENCSRALWPMIVESPISYNLRLMRLPASTVSDNDWMPSVASREDYGSGNND
ncbi:Large ribosomal subunit protein [Trichinella pseudospiralis]